MTNKKYPIGEDRISHVHELMKHAHFAIKETVRCLEYSTLIEFSEEDEMATSQNVEKLREVVPVLKDMVSTFSFLESLMLSRESSKVSGWEVSDRIEKISHMIFPSLFMDGYPPLESHELDEGKIKGKLIELKTKHEELISENRNLSFEYKRLCEDIRDGEYNTDEQREKIEKEIEKASKMRLEVNVFVDGEANVIYVENEETAEKYRGKHFKMENGELKPV